VPRFFGRGLDGLALAPLKALRPLRTDQYGIRTFVEVDGVPVKLEIVREARIELSGALLPLLPVSVLSRADLFAEKLLANADRWADRAAFNRDAIDLGMMIAHWGPIPEDAWSKAWVAYGDTIDAALSAAAERISDPTWLKTCVEAMHMAAHDGARAVGALASAVALRSVSAMR
jgi:hypothetical protein